MAKELKDIYRGHRPYAFVLIGGEPVRVTEYDMTVTTRGEAGVATVTIPLDNIDGTVFADSEVIDHIHEVEIWAGYLADTEKFEDQVRDFLSTWDKKNVKDPSRKFSRRFEGYVSQPEFRHGQERTLTLSCIDWCGFLKEFKWARELEGSACEVRNILNLMKSDIDGLIVNLKNYNGNVYLGEIDTTENKIVYNCVGRSYWDLLEEIAVKLAYVIIPNGKEINLVPKKDNPMLWTMYYGAGKNEKSDDPDGAAIGQYFDNLCIRYGTKGQIDKSNVVVEVFGVHIAKKAKTDKAKKGKGVHVIFGVTETKSGRKGQPRPLDPKDVPITTNTKHIVIKVPGNCTEAQARVIAESAYRQYATRMVTGTVDLPFANHFIELQDLIAFYPDSTTDDMNYLKGIKFSVNSISERFGMNGYNQSVEFDSDPMVEDTPKERISPKITKKKL